MNTVVTTPSIYAPKTQNHAAVLAERKQNTIEVKSAFNRILLVGDFGEGKTYTIGLIDQILKAAGTKGVYLLDVDQGSNTLSSAGFDVDFEVLRDWSRFSQVMNVFMNGNQGYGAFAVDGLTTLQKVTMRYVHRVSQAKRPMGGLISNQQDYGALIQVLEQTFTQMLEVSLHMDLILTAHIQERQNETTAMIEALPAVVGKKMPSAMGLWFNEVWRVYTTRTPAVVRHVQTQPGNRYKCKSQVNKMPAELKLVDALDLLYADWKPHVEETVDAK